MGKNIYFMEKKNGQNEVWETLLWGINIQNMTPKFDDNLCKNNRKSLGLSFQLCLLYYSSSLQHCDQKIQREHLQSMAAL